jgi:hypothetical protein
LLNWMVISSDANGRSIHPTSQASAPRQWIMTNRPTPFLFRSVGRKRVVAAFDGGRITSNGGVVLLATTERRLGIAESLVSLHSLGHIAQ